MKPDFKIVAIDETEYWNIPEYPEISKIWTLYLTDTSIETYCCEMTPSYWLQPVSFFIEYNESFVVKNTETGIDDYDTRLCEIEDMVRENFTYEGIYVHCGSVIAYNKKDSAKIKVADYGLTDDERTAIEEGEVTEQDVLDSVSEYFSNTTPYIANGRLVI